MQPLRTDIPCPGDTDWLGIDDGFRAPSQELLNATANGNQLKLKSRFSGIGVPAEQLEVVGESFNNQYHRRKNLRHRMSIFQLRLEIFTILVRQE